MALTELESIQALATTHGVVTAAVAAGGNALTDSTKNWITDIHKNRLVKIVKGQGAGQLAHIQANSITTLVIRGAWEIAIGAGADYVILDLDLTQILSDSFGTYADAKALGDGLQGPTYERVLGRSLNYFWNGRIGHPDGVARRIDVDAYWVASGLRCPVNYTWLACYSRKSFAYPMLRAYGRLAALGGGIQTFLGFESQSSLYSPLVCIHEAGAIANFVARTSEVLTQVVITGLLPADYATASHEYGIKVNRCNAEFFIDGVLKAVILLGVPEGTPVWQNTEPYCLAAARSAMFTTILPAFTEVNNVGAQITLPINGFGGLVAADGDPLPPRQYALYTENTNTKWAGLAPGAAVTSHPVPVWGYPTKTLLFQSDAAGTLDIEVYSGGAWRVWESITLVANQLEVYNLNGEVPIARCVYTPTNADTITLAEWDLS